MKHLWEYDHPYYCKEGNYLASPVEHGYLDCWERHDSWRSFLESDWGDSDSDLNLVFRWDWKAWHLEFPEDYPDEHGRAERHELTLFFMLQRKALSKSVQIDVTPEDEPAVREWLEARARKMVAIWQPLIAIDCGEADL